ncbi:PREDICTED: uncharacterized protein LOC108688767 isoform X2 [Atta colombica]|uniref:uncharacterized protein LOC108688767 isoform X2 n=1 Tax=Atta colombica TaxID=520822 RepID=UPI00084CB8BE|nr:PREDICTED: uncharacterized protein LOC108688767 isoform X2 [Atta colombica]
MMIRLVFCFLISVFVTANFVDTYRYNDDIQQLNENVMQKLLHTLHNNEYKDKRRNIEDEFENWNGRWMPDRPDDPKPPPKVFPKNQQQYEYESVTELPHKMYWPGHWMPDRPGNPKPPPKVFPKNQQQHEYESITELPNKTPEGWMSEKLNDLKLPFKISNNEQSHEYRSIEEFPHEIYMGRVSPECDDAKTNLTIDWDHTPSEYTCYDHTIIPSKITARIYCENIPKMYKAAHKCMNQRIEYDDDIPLYGPHRPLWPVYGEYKYLPKQRWLHSLEHGAIVMLYHPCANPLEVKRLKNLISKCLWRHIITPYNYLEEERQKYATKGLLSSRMIRQDLQKTRNYPRRESRLRIIVIPNT